ncbi:adenylate/guanylate cyclase domain-containing protein [Prosthecobacter sp.]|uniref:adenylate/guanylate cyclase domain-containing protein n=1 Tax=Prosthecobacter sp. TaxID=1965333 RepID=UPI001D8FA712|nr:adenylate/guanylate cyclase domain-containing protein [Prosthecobacter sp.]MCB1275936.1 adenylate/guanylate cyclase domain-containing protein [Prosthecobacter sp.]
MNFRVLRFAPQIITLVMGVLMVCLDWLANEKGALEFIQRFEVASYDWRLRQERLPAEAGKQVGVVYVDERSAARLKEKLDVSWPVPRWIHGVILGELKAQGARSVGYDIFFTRLRPEDKAPTKSGLEPVSSDGVFIGALKQSGHVVLGAPMDPSRPGDDVVMPAVPFTKAAAAVGHAVGRADADGVLRRVSPVVDDPVAGRIWQLGIQTAALGMGLDLDHAQITPWQLSVPDRQGIWHQIPLDGHGRLIIPWRLPSAAAVSAHNRSFVEMLGDAERRRKPGDESSFWKDRLVIVGSFGANPPLADAGPTPLGPRTPYCATHWNIADAMMRGAFIHTPGPVTRIGITLALMLAVSVLSWKLRALWATAAAVILSAGYVACSVWLLHLKGLWLPMAIPLLGATSITHVTMTFYRLLIEKSHKRRLRSIFQQIVSPRLLEMILDQPQISWAPQQKVMTVFFADIRDFTVLTDASRLDRIGLLPDDQEADPVHRQAVRDQHALNTVNLYLTLVVDTIKKHGATLDKYMGDCVMAFWGAPLDERHHAAKAVRAAVEVQQGLHVLNSTRKAENERIEMENKVRQAQSLPLQPLNALLTLGTGINTGLMTAGFMGSEAHLSNYTVFGREVNLAARLESLSGSGRILISQTTFDAVASSDPELASTARSIGTHQVKGIQQPMQVYEVLWQKNSEKTNKTPPDTFKGTELSGETQNNTQP